MFYVTIDVSTSNYSFFPFTNFKACLCIEKKTLKYVHFVQPVDNEWGSKCPNANITNVYKFAKRVRTSALNYIQYRLW